MEKKEIISRAKKATKMSTKIRIIIENSGLKPGEEVTYDKLGKIFEEYIDEQVFQGFEDKYGDKKSDKDLNAYIRHHFQGLVHGEDKKKNKGLIVTTNEKGHYLFNGGNTINEGDENESAFEDLISNGVKQIILTGAPGTGKTYLSKKIANKFGEKMNSNTNYEFVQFHPSFDYTDFVEGIRPVEIHNTMHFKKIDGIFKSFCRKVADNNEEMIKNNDDYKEKKYFFIIDEINRADLSKVFGELMYGLETDKRGEIFKTQYQNIKTYDLENNKDLTDDIFSKGFYIPENIYVIGTMNDIDRSVESMDFALRRRFTWVEVKVSREFSILKEDIENVLKVSDEILDKIVESTISLNEFIEREGKKYSLNEHYFISQGYFANIPKADEMKLDEILKFVWNYRLNSLIYEYVRGQNNADIFVKECKKIFLSNSGY